MTAETRPAGEEENTVLRRWKLRRVLSPEQIESEQNGIRRRLPEWEFVRYTWDFPQKIPGMLETLAKHRPRVVLLHSDKEVQAWLKQVGRLRPCADR